MTTFDPYGPGVMHPMRYSETFAPVRRWAYFAEMGAQMCGRDTGRLHGPRAPRIFDAGRAEQGFRDQAHLDAFFASYDHNRACAQCSRPGPAMPLDDGMQPSAGPMCSEGVRLFVASRPS